jgi:translocator protein
MERSACQPVTVRRPWLGLAGWLIACFGAASLGVLFGPGEWYASLRKPSWNPPNWIFAPVWSLLYVMMAFAAWLVWRRGGFAKQIRPLTLFLIQLILNALWTSLFFGLHSPRLAFVEIVLLWIGIMATLLAFYRVSIVAAGLLVPYLAWVSFAAFLNMTLWRLNY